MGTSSHIFIAKLDQFIEEQQSSTSDFFTKYQKKSASIQKAAVAEFVVSYSFFAKFKTSILQNAYEACPNETFKNHLATSHPWLTSKKRSAPKSEFRELAKAVRTKFEFKSTPMITGKFWGQRLAELTKDNWLGSLLCWYYLESVALKDQWSGVVALAKKNEFFGSELDSFFAKNWEITPATIESQLTQLFDQEQDSQKREWILESQQMIETAFRIRNNYWQQLEAHMNTRYQQEQLKIAS